MMDLHTHLDLYPNALELAREVNKTNIFTLCVTTSPRAWLATARVFGQFLNIEVGLGLHPEIVANKYGERDVLLQGISLARYIGEIGLDGSPQYAPFRLRQKQIFENVLTEASRVGGRILSLHSRRAVSDVLSALKNHPKAGTAVLHWFSGSVHELNDAIDLGCYFSVNTLMASSERGARLISLMPRDKVLPESDGPFAVKGNVPLSPMTSTSGVAQCLSTIWGMPQEEILSTFQTTLKRLRDGIS